MRTYGKTPIPGVVKPSVIWRESWEKERGEISPQQ